MNELFFTSDIHFGHANIIKYCARPFISVEEMTEELVDNWNSVVKHKSDTVYHLGDFAFLPTEKKREVFNRLRGVKFTLRGNHDEDADSIGWQRVYDYKELKVGKQHIVLCHYPMVTWNRASRGSWMLHGHCHGNIDNHNEGNTRLDVGVDSHNYSPVSFDEVRQIMSTREYDRVDHHGEPR